MPPHLKKTIDQENLESGTYEQIVKLLERELEVNGLEAAGELPVNINRQPTEENEKKKLAGITEKHLVITSLNAER